MPGFTLGISSWVFLNGTEAPLKLESSKVVTLSAYDVETCRPDCTRPRCGDGILDGGEICDDGNTSGGDACPAGCK